MHHQSNRAALVTEREREAAQRLADRIGNGSQITVDDFARLTYAERVQLRSVDSERYQALAAGHEPGAWRPTTHGATSDSTRMAEADL